MDKDRYPNITMAEYLAIPIRGEGVYDSIQRFGGTEPKVNALNSYLQVRYDGLADGFEFGDEKRSYDVRLQMYWVTE